MRPYITIISRLYDELAKARAYIDVGSNLHKVRKYIAKAEHRLKDNVRQPPYAAYQKLYPAE